MYRIREGVCLVSICNYLYLMVTRDHSRFNQEIYRLTPSGAMYWNYLKQGLSEEEISISVSKKYGICPQKVKEALKPFLKKLVLEEYILEE